MDKIIIVDFGGQCSHLICRRVRDLGVVSEIWPPDISAAKLLADKEIKGVILSGGARSVYETDAPKFDKSILQISLPILGICYGHQLIAQSIGGQVIQGQAGEYGLTKLKIKQTAGIFSGLNRAQAVWMNHRDIVAKLPSSFQATAQTEHSPVAAFMSLDQRISGVQFHPEVSHTKGGDQMLKNFVFKICGCKKSDRAKSPVAPLIEEAKITLGQDKAIIGLSGGVDSSVAAALVSRAIGKNLTAVYVDTGLMRYQETEFIKRIFKHSKLNLKIIQAQKEFFSALKGIAAPEKKRKIIGRLFVDIFSRAAKQEKAVWLIQGTIYSDRIESGLTKHSAKIKSHHNVGGLPKNLKLKLYEPLKELYKDEVRLLARQLKLDQEIATRQVFPGPGLAIRIAGEVTPERAGIARLAGHIVEQELKKAKLWHKIYMGFAILLPLKSVGIQGDERTDKYPLVVRIIESTDVMTANFSKIPWPVMERISTRITNEIKQVNRVLYDISNKPPATMEWE